VTLRRVFPTADEFIDLDAPDARERLAELYALPRTDWVRLNLVGSVSGNATGLDGTSESLTNPTDRLILKAIRSLSDVVVVGASTVRAEGYFVPRSGALAVVSRTGDFSAHQLKGTANNGTLVVLCPESAVETARATIPVPGLRVIAVPDEQGSLTARAIVTALRGEGYASIVTEGGPELAALFVTGGVVDELCLTTSPVLNGAGLPLFGAAEFDDHPLELTQLLIDGGGATYARWSLGRGVTEAG
jgi:riboflavin biosynthesis pyrimidine reductase